MGEVVGEEEFGDGVGVVVEGPGEGAGIGDFDEADTVGEGEAEGVDEGPVAVKAGEVDEGGEMGRAVDAELEGFGGRGWPQGTQRGAKRRGGMDWCRAEGGHRFRAYVREATGETRNRAVSLSGDGGVPPVLADHGGRLGCPGGLLRRQRMGRQLAPGFSLGGGMSFRPGKKFVQIVAKIGCQRRARAADFLDDQVFHNWGWVNSDGVQITGMWRW